jgi:hypothetical protein
VDPLVIALVVVGAGLMVARTVQTVRASINHIKLTEFIIEKIKRRRTDHAHAICDSIPTVAFGKMIKATLVAAGKMPRDWSADESRQHLRDVFAGARNSALEALRDRAWHGWLAPIIACGGVVLSLEEQDGPSTLAIAFAAVTFMGSIASASRVRKIVLSSKTHANKIVEALVEAHGDPTGSPDAEPADRIMRGDFPSLNELINENTRTPRALVAERTVAVSTETAITDKLLDLRNGTCPLCKDRDIGTGPLREEQFVAFVCRGCGYTQWFAEDPKAATTEP